MYATVDDLVEELSAEVLLELTDDADTGDLEDAGVQAISTDALEDAAALIDSYAGARYVVPLDPVPAIINKDCTLLAAYYLYLRRGVVPPPVQTAFDQAVAWLKDVSKGTATLGPTEPEQPLTPDALGGTVRLVVAGPQIFTRESLANY
jgi:phage gp36-like protein